MFINILTYNNIMNAKKLILGIFVLSVLITSVVFAVDGITYDFDEVNVLYAAEFTAVPIEGVDSSDTWISNLVEDDDRLTITYGVVELKKEGQVLITEEFLKVGEGENSKRFLVNSAVYDYYDETSRYSKIRSFFWSAKKLEGTSVVKDFTNPTYSASFSRSYNEDESRDSFFLSFSNDG